MITANTGSLFEDEIFEEPFLNLMAEELNEKSPDFVVVHFQEMCGKHWNTRDTKECADDFTAKLVAKVPGYWNSGMIFQPAKDGKDKGFNALAAIVFAKQHLVDGDRIGVWDFDQQERVACSSEGFELGSSHYRCQTFPSDMFPGIKVGRKGWLHTRFVVDERPVDFVNLHNFHDASNLVSLKLDCPSLYAVNRERAMTYMLENVSFDNESGRAFLFGDFNFRLELSKVVNHLIGAEREEEGDASDAEASRRFSSSRNTLVVAPKKFELGTTVSDWPPLRDFDVEPAQTIGKVAGEFSECAIHFNPTYPYEEDISKKDDYLRNRCPGWCDRIFMSASSMAAAIDPTYDVMGMDVCVGDHKPVFLQFDMKT